MADAGQAGHNSPAHTTVDAHHAVNDERAQGWFASVKNWAKSLKQEVLAVHYATQDPHTPWYAKFLPALALAYALSPLDLIPDFIPVIGFLDDFILLPLLIWLAIKLIPAEVMHDSRERAKNEPFRLDKNWVSALVIVVLWLVPAEWLVYTLCKRYGNSRLQQQYVWGIMLALAVVCISSFTVWLIRAFRKQRKRKEESLLDNSAENLPL